MFRPSGNGIDFLALTIKQYDNIYINIAIKEITNENGNRNYILFNQSYGSLDEIIKMYINVISEQIREVINSDKFRYKLEDNKKLVSKEVLEE